MRINSTVEIIYISIHQHHNTEIKVTKAIKTNCQQK